MSGGDDNGECEFTVVSGNFNATGNKANGVAIGGPAARPSHRLPGHALSRQ